MEIKSFVNLLNSMGLLHIVNEEKSKIYEASNIAYKIKMPVLFNNINGFKVVANLISSREIISLLLNIPKKDITHFLSSKLNNIKGILIKKGMLKLDNIVENDIDIQKFPIFKFFEKEGGNGYITAGIVVSKYNGKYNASIHRLMVLGPDKLGIRIVSSRHTDILYKEAKSMNDPLPVAILIGVDPIITYACSTRVPLSKEFEYASSIKNNPIDIYTCSNGVEVPYAEVIIEGFISPDDYELEGPFVDITGSFDLERLQPVLTISKIHYQNDFIFQVILPSSMEHLLLMGSPYESKIFNYVNDVVNVKDVILTEGSFCYFHCLIQIVKQSEGDGKNAIIGAFSAHSGLKHVIVVDDDINIHNYKSIEYALATRVNGMKDIVFIENAKGSSLDPSISENGTITKIGIDATKPIIGLKDKYKKVI